MIEPKFYVLNDFDRPDKYHVVQKMGNDGNCDYLHSDSTLVDDFGFVIKINFETLMASFNLCKPPTSCYETGDIRFWQGAPKFTLPFKCVE